MNYKKYIPLAILILLSVASFSIRFSMLQQTEYANGLDGYYYVGQVSSLVEQGHFRSFENSIILYLLSIFYLLIKNPIVAIKIGIVFLASLSILGSYLFGKQITNSQNSGMVLAGLIAFSPSVSYLTIHFMKNAGALFILFFFLYYLDRLFSEEDSGCKKRLLRILQLSLAGIILFFSHKLIFLIGLFCVSPYILRIIFSSPKRAYYSLLFIAIMVGVTIVSIYFKIIIPEDIFRLISELNPRLQWPITEIAKSVSINSSLKFEIYLFLSLIPLAIVLFKKAKLTLQYYFYILLMVILFNPFVDYSSLDLGYRLVLMLFLPGSIIFMLVLHCIPRKHSRFIYPFCFVLLLYFGFSTQNIYAHTYDTNQYREYSTVVEKLKGKNYLLVIAHQGLNYYYDTVTKNDALAYVPDESKYPDVLTWRISYGINYDGYMSVLPKDYTNHYPPIQALTDRYYLVREDLWKYFLTKLHDNDYLKDIVYSWRNPYQKRPVYIGKRDNSKSSYCNIHDIDPTILVDLKYSSKNNFLGYDAYGNLEDCFLLYECAVRLKKAHDILKANNPDLRFVVYDGLRPRSIQIMMWNRVKGTPMQKYVANPAIGSIHSYGAAVDLSIQHINGTILDMGTPFDYFGELAEPRYEDKLYREGKLTKMQIKNRLLLRNCMEQAGFKSLSIEWWHFNMDSFKKIKERYKIIE